MQSLAIPQLLGRSAGVTVRVLAEGDAAPLYNAVARNRSHLLPFMPAVANVGSEADAATFIRRVQKNFLDSGRFWAGIWLGERYAGSVGLTDLDFEHRQAEWGVWLATDFTGGGVATVAAKILCGRLFDSYNLHRVGARCAVQNVRSVALLERLGFVREGRLREAEFANGIARDLFVYGLLSHEWRP